MVSSSHYKDILYDHFEGIHSDATDEKYNLRPFYAISNTEEQPLLDWLNETLQCLGDENATRADNQVNNIRFYEGIHTLEKYPDTKAEDGQARPISLENRFVMNHILDFTVQKHSRFLRYAAKLNVLPWNNEYKNKLGARISKKTIDSNFYSLDVDTALSDLVMNAILCGEGFVFCEWDKYRGDLDQEVKRAQELKERGIAAEFKNVDGEPIKLEELARIGDHKLDIPLPFFVLHQPRTRWADVDYVFKASLKHIDELKAENPGTDFSNIKTADTSKKKGSHADYGGSRYGEWYLQWEFYHRHHRFLPKGKYVRFVEGILLEAKDLPYAHGQLPVVRFTDYDSPVSAHGWSFYESLKLPSVMINNMMKVAYRSFCIAAYPKLIAPENSFNYYSMANGPFVIEYVPNTTPPQLVTFNGVQQEFFTLSDHVERFMEKNSGTFGISRGESMPNARARSILNFYEEQEEKRESSQISKYNACIEKLGKMILTNSGQYYRAEDQRTLKIVGKNNAYKVRELQDVTQLTGPYVVRVERTTALSESKQGKIDQIVALSQVPLSESNGQAGLFTREQVLKMIEIADTDSFFEMATAAAERAESENEDMFEGIPVPAPEEWQAHLVDWNVHFQFIQSKEFSDIQGLPPEIKSGILDHLMAHEMFLYSRAKTNLKLAETLMENAYFPCVFKPSMFDLPLSQIVLMLQQPPMPPPMPGAEGGTAPNPEEGAGTDQIPEEVPPGEMPPGEDVAMQMGAEEGVVYE